MVPLVRRTMVEKERFLKESEFMHGFSLVQALPGVLAVNTACFVGNKVRGVPGALVCIAGAVMPSFFIILAVAAVFGEFRHIPLLQSFMRGATPAVAALIASAVLDMGWRGLDTHSEVVMAVLLAGAVLVFSLHPLWVVIGGGVWGLLRRP